MAKVTNISVLSEATRGFLEINRKRQKKKSLNAEGRLLAVTILLAILFLVFFILFIMADYYYNQMKKEKVCTSRECIESAMTLLQTVDFTQDPCEDFYAFACGRFNVDHPIPETYVHNSWFVEKENRLSRLVLDILKTSASEKDLKSVAQTKELYRSCVNKSELNSIGLKPLYEILELLELPKSVPNNKTVGNFSLGKTLALAQRHLSQDILVAVSIFRGVFNTSEESARNSTILKISPGVNKINVFDVWRPDTDIYHQKRFFKFRRKTDFDRPIGKDKKTSKQVIIATLKFIAEILEEISNDLETSSAPEDDVSSHHVTTAYKILTFTSALVEDLDASNDTDYNSTGVEQMTFSTLQFILEAESGKNSTSNQIDWKEYISILFEKVNNTYDTDTEPVMVENLEYFKFLTRVLTEAKPETIQRHIWWKIVEEYAKYTTSDMRAIYYRYYQALYGESSSSARSHVCGALIKEKMNVALSYEMSKVNNLSVTITKVHEMLKDIEKAFEDLVRSMPWMDPGSKAITLDKASSVKNEIGYADWLMDPEAVENHYRGLELKKSDFLMNLMRISEWEVQKILMIIGPDKENSSNNDGWYINPLQVNAYYSRDENAIIIPPGILQTPFYFRGLESLNYGAIGTILGHELTHGFDIEGKNYNKDGKRQDNWWPSDITAKYESKAKCFVRQYENYTLYENTKLNGTLTLAENIADNGGIRESYRAYRLYVDRNGDELKLPGFENFTHDQLLFLSYANIWCEATNSKYYEYSTDTHSPQRVRVLASLQNMKEFSTVFKCSENSFMNPSNKCIIW